MGRLKIIALFAAGLVLAAVFAYPSVARKYNDWGRSLIYPSSSKLTQFPGEGRITQSVEPYLFIIPKVTGEPFYDNVEDRAQYPEGPEGFEVYEIQAQDQLLESIGVFESWEDIPGSLDKYLIIRYPASTETEKYRLAFEPSDLFKDQATALAVENTGWRLNRKIVNSVERTDEFNLYSLGYDVVRQLLRPGDAIVLSPVFDPPELAKKDPDQNYLASWLMLRRAGGKKTLEREI